MNYTSTRDSRVSVPSAVAIANGIAPDGGLYVPTELPPLTAADFEELGRLPYPAAAARVLSLFLTDFTGEEINDCTAGAYLGSFEEDEPAPLVPLSASAYSLELWHGPTCAFKDLALQILPHLLTRAAAKTAKGQTRVILVATSGDTGKAALEGFANVPGVKILVFYPSEGVSAMQKRQMITQRGDNVGVFGIRGNFDDAQTGVKQIFTDPAAKEQLAAHGMGFSSANSINWGRLAPQIVYYVVSYARLLKQGALKPGDEINFVVPTGNFGNILAAYYAGRMGVPVGRLVCASNRNNVLTDFINTGVYDRNRPFYTTLSPSMDILISSNLERLLYHVTGGDCERVAEWMSELAATGRYRVDDETRGAIASLFAAGCADDTAAKAAIAGAFQAKGYLADPHTGVALSVYGRYVTETQDSRVSVIASTASPFKFAGGVLSALGAAPQSADDFAATGYAVPKTIAELKTLRERFTTVCEKGDMWAMVAQTLGL